MGMEMDQLDIVIEAQAKNAAQKVDALYASLTNVGNALQALIPDLSKAIAQFQVLQRVDLSNLNKKLDFNIKLDGSEIQKTEEATRLAAGRMSAYLKRAADDMIQAYHITNVAVKKEIQEVFQSMATGMSHNKGWDQRVLDAASFTPSEVREMTGEVTDGMQREWEEFLNYFNTHKIQYTQDVQEMVRNMELISGKKGSSNMSHLFSTESGVNLESGWNDLVRMFPNILGNVEMLDAEGGKIGDRLALIITRLSQAKEETTRLSVADNDALGPVVENMISRLDQAKSGIKGIIEETKNNLSGDKIMVDIEVNQEKIVNDIRLAVNKASKAKFDPVQIDLKVDKNSVVNAVSNELKNMQIGNLGAVADAYERISNALVGLANMGSHGKTINNMVNSITRLSKVDMSGFDTAKFADITSSIASLAAIPDASNNVNKMINSLTRLAKSGADMQTTANTIPAFAGAIRDAFNTIGSASIDENSTALLGAISRLSGAGTAMQTAAQNLPNLTTSVQGFFSAMSQAPVLSETTLRMTEALAQLAQRGSKLGPATTGVSNAFRQMSKSGTQAQSALSGLASKVSKGVQTAFKGMASAIGAAASAVAKGAKIIVNHFTLIGGASSKIRKATSSLKGLLGAAVGFYGVRSLFNWGKQAIELSSDLTEVQNVVENAFGREGTEAVEEFVKSSIESFGMSELTAKEISSRYQAMGRSMGLTGQMVADANKVIAKSVKSDLYDTTTEATSAMSLNLTKLAADMASFYNKDQSEVAESLNAIFTGQTRPLRQYGVDLTQATLQEWALKQGIDADVQSMTQAQKTMLRYQYVMANTAIAQGDFSRTSFTWANQTRILKQQFEMLGKTVGEVLINVFRPLVVWLNQAMAKVISFAETIGNALGKIFGWTIIHTPAGSTMEDMEDTFSDIGDSAGDAADGTKAANKALKEYQNTVLGFDELNKLNAVPENTTPSGSGSGGGAGSTGGTSGAAGDQFALARTDNLIEYYKSEIDSLFKLGSYISEKLSGAMESIDWKSIYEKARNFGTGLAEFLNGLITPRLFGDLGITIASAINTVLNANDAFLDKFSFTNLGQSIASGINGFFETYDFDLQARTFYKTINGIIEAIRAAAEDISWNSVGSKIGLMLRKMFLNLDWTMAATTFSKVVLEIIEAMRSAIDAFASDRGFYVLGRRINAALRAIPWENILTSAGTVVWEGFNAALDFGKGLFSGTPFEEVLEKLQTKLNRIAEKIDFDTISKGVGDIVKALAPAGAGFASGLTDVFGTLADLGVDFLNSVGEVFQKIADALNSLPEGVVAQFGRDLGQIAGWFIVIVGAGKVATVFAGVAEAFAKLAGLGKVATIITSASGAAETAATTGGFAKLLAVIGSEAIKGSLIAGVALLGVKMTELYDVLRGGNGVGSTEANAFEKLLMSLKDSGKYTDELNDKVFTLTEKLEDGKITSEQYGRQMTDAFEDAGISAADVEEALNGLQGSAKLTDTQVGIVRQTLGELSGTVETTGQKISNLNGDPKVAMQALRDAVYDAYNTSGDFAALYDSKVLPVIEDVDWKDDVEGAYNAVIEALQDAGLETGEFENAIREHLPNISGVVNTEAANAARDIGSLRSDIRNLSNDSKTDSTTFRDNLVTAFSRIASEAGLADTDTGTFKTNLWKFAGGMAVQALSVALMGGAFGGIGEKAEGAQTLVGAFGELISKTVSGIKDEAKVARSNGEEITKGTAEGMTDVVSIQELERANQTIANKITGGTRMLMAIKSPSGVMKELGGYITLGLAEGIKSQAGVALANMVSTLTDLKSRISGELGNFRDQGTALAQQFKNGLQGVSFSDVARAWKNSIDLSGLNDTLYNAGQDAANSLRNGMRSVTMPKLQYYISQWNYHNLPGGGQSATPVYSPNWYKLGGFPNMGELFVANEAGPEMVGKMGRKNVVANNMQITEGIRAAVVDGMMEAAMSGAFGRSSDNTPVVLNATIRTPDGDVLARVVERAQARRDARYSTLATT